MSPAPSDTAVTDGAEPRTRTDPARALAAEALGTAGLLATVVGSGIMGERLADGSAALALLANSLATGAMLAVLILVLGPVSGAHLNPAVTLAFALRGRIGRRRACAYVGAQAAGGLVGTWVAHAMFALPLLQVSTTARTGPAQWFAEMVAAFGLVATVLGCLRAGPRAIAYAVGLYIAAAYWFTASTSFANPAVTLARGFTDSFSGIRPMDAPAFIAAQLVGAAAAALVFGWLLASHEDG